MTTPLKDLIDQAMNGPAAADATDLALAQRRMDAREIWGRLPEFLRQRLPVLESRVHEPEMLQTARAWRLGGPSLLFLGPTGLGKSTAAAVVLYRLLAQGVREGGEAWEYARDIQYFKADLLARARREHPMGKGDAPEVHAAARASLLVIDDAGWDREVQTTAEILDERYGRCRATIVTSGKTKTELVAHYSAAVVRRLTESGNRGCIVIERFPPKSDPKAEP